MPSSRLTPPAAWVETVMTRAACRAAAHVLADQSCRARRAPKTCEGSRSAMTSWIPTITGTRVHTGT